MLDNNMYVSLNQGYNTLCFPTHFATFFTASAVPTVINNHVIKAAVPVTGKANRNFKTATILLYESRVGGFFFITSSFHRKNAATHIRHV